ncbi:Na+/H+ antiporter [Tenggerimyces flavus]|uniref:Na+/H+ antiporter n=1 Tax=Tenggerimyces flavus TaxID=1708749 RepID=A0ABV7Y4B9_9ACTN|nr:Na+/H+ antiporter [Tenggerimyces flavus]MBM7790536.1 CPA1 family monovalent cation:H+ antiporter [Tenggerimyces flavus]
MAETLLRVVLLLAVVGVVSGFARRFGLIRPVVLVIVGIGLSFLPFFPEYALDPDLILQVVLPLLVYIAAVGLSVPGLRSNIRPVMLLAVGHVLFIAALVGFALHAVVPDIPLAAAFALGAIVAPPDAVAASSIAKRIGLPRRTVTILEGEALINDATALVTLRVVAAAATGAAVTWQAVGREAAIAAIGGVAIGAVVALIGAFLHKKTDDKLLDNTISLLLPFAAFVPAEYVHASGVAAVVTCGLYIGHRKPLLMSAGSRLQMDSVFRVVNFLLEGAVFLLVGLQIRSAATNIGLDLGTVVAATVVVVLAVIIGRFVWVYPAAYLPRLSRKLREREGPRPPGQVAVVAWAGPRGVVSLGAVLSLSIDFPYRGLLVWITFVVIIVTLVGQGLTLPIVARWLNVHRDDPQADILSEANVRQQAYRAAVRRLDELIEDSEVAGYVVDRLRTLAENRANQAWERLGDPNRETPSEALRRLRLEMLRAERQVLIEARDEGRLEDELLRRIQGELDLEEILLVKTARDEATL